MLDAKINKIGAYNLEVHCWSFQNNTTGLVLSAELLKPYGKLV